MLQVLVEEAELPSHQIVERVNSRLMAFIGGARSHHDGRRPAMTGLCSAIRTTPRKVAASHFTFDVGIGWDDPSGSIQIGMASVPEIAMSSWIKLIS